MMMWFFCSNSAGSRLALFLFAITAAISGCSSEPPGDQKPEDTGVSDVDPDTEDVVDTDVSAVDVSDTAETGPDCTDACGGICPPCQIGEACSTNSDCQSGLCEEQICVECTSDDGCTDGDVCRDNGCVDPCEEIPTLEDVSGDWKLAEDVVWDREPDPNSFEEVFGREFPGAPNSVDFYLDKDRYAAIRFTTPSNLHSDHRGRWTEESHYYLTSGTRWVSISRCPGNFDPETFEQAPCIKRWRQSESGVRWVGPDHAFAETRCELEPETTYYYNLLYSRDELIEFPPTQHDCQDDPQCGHLTQSRHTYSSDD